MSTYKWEDLEEILGVKRDTIQSFIRRHQLPISVIRRGKHNIFNEADLDVLLTSYHNKRRNFSGFMNSQTKKKPVN